MHESQKRVFFYSCSELEGFAWEDQVLSSNHTLILFLTNPRKILNFQTAIKSIPCGLLVFMLFLFLMLTVIQHQCLLQGINYSKFLWIACCSPFHIKPSNFSGVHSLKTATQPNQKKNHALSSSRNHIAPITCYMFYKWSHDKQFQKAFCYIANKKWMWGIESGVHHTIGKQNCTKGQKLLATYAIISWGNKLCFWQIFAQPLEELLSVTTQSNSTAIIVSPGHNATLYMQQHR